MCLVWNEYSFEVFDTSCIAHKYRLSTKWTCYYYTGQYMHNKIDKDELIEIHSNSKCKERVS